jgi:hypothetical protein
MTSSEIKERQKERFRFLHKLYRLTDGRAYKPEIKASKVGREIGFDKRKISDILTYLRSEELIHYSHGNRISMSHQGIKEIEQALSKPDEPTPHFPPYNITYNITVHGDMVSSQVAQGSPGASQVINIGTEKYPELKQIIETIKEAIDKLPLERTHKSELQSELMTVEVQLSSPNPKAAIINESVGSIRRILESVAASAIAQTLLALLISLRLNTTREEEKSWLLYNSCRRYT